jgi:hypothetical protein
MENEKQKKFLSEFFSCVSIERYSALVEVYATPATVHKCTVALQELFCEKYC